jgi:regulator of replication initiation timing
MPIVNVTDISKDFVAEAIARMEKDIQTVARAHRGLSKGHEKVVREWQELERENAALRAALDAQMKYQRDLRADRDRLDWVLTPIGSAVVYGHIRDNLLLTRDNIDRAMGVKP